MQYKTITLKAKNKKDMADGFDMITIIQGLKVVGYVYPDKGKVRKKKIDAADARW